MRKFVKAVLVLWVIGAVSYIVLTGVAASKAAAKLDLAKAALIQEAHSFDREARGELAQKWKVVAQDYLDDYERGQLDGVYEEARRGYEQHTDPSGWGMYDNDTCAIKAYQFVCKAVEQKHREAGDYDITDEKIDAILATDHRIQWLNELQAARHELRVCREKAADAKSMAEVDQIESDLEDKKHKLVLLLKTVS